MTDDAGGLGFPTFASGGFAQLPQPDYALPNRAGASAVGVRLSADAAKQYVLNKIASGEANSYSELYGGNTFQGFASHPKVPIPITSGPNVGKYSTAAGRYQFIGSTWDAQAKKLGLTDFTPDSQDAAAWDLANTTYKQQTGRDLTADAQAGNVKWGALGGQWESLAGAGDGPGVAKANWSGRKWNPVSSTGEQTATGDNLNSSSPVGAPQAPDPTRQLALQMLQNLQSKPAPAGVSYDPMKYVPRLT